MTLGGFEWVDGTFVFTMLLCFVVSWLSYKMRYWPLALISSIGLILVSFNVYNATGDTLIMGLMWLISFAQIMLVMKRDRR